jgi:FKBP-type peptidyl-prolyl cis-trans isomerase
LSLHFGIKGGIRLSGESLYSPAIPGGLARQLARHGPSRLTALISLHFYILHEQGKPMKKARFVGGWLMLFVVSGWVVAQERLPVATDKAAGPDAAVASQYSYSIGQDIGSSFRSDGLPLEIESLLAGIRDGLNDAQPKFDEETCTQSLHQLGMLRMQAHVARNRAYLEKNSQAEGVKVLPSGLQYKVLKEGAGASPKLTNRVWAHYRGEFIDGTMFDSSEGQNQPADFRVNGVIPGWTEALQLMKPGSRWQLVIPSKLAYGDDGRPGIPPHATLVFEVELIRID